MSGDTMPVCLPADDAVELLPRLVGERTRAIVAVHYGGVPCDMHSMLNIAEAVGAAVIEDAAHAVFGNYDGHPLGTLGTFGALSFHESKNLTAGEGGALIVNDEVFVGRASEILHKGTDRLRFERGEVDAYSWVSLGSSYAPSDILAAVLLAQLERSEEILGARSRIWNRYRAELVEWARRHHVGIPVDCDSSQHIFWLLFPDRPARGRGARAPTHQWDTGDFSLHALARFPTGVDRRSG